MAPATFLGSPNVTVSAINVSGGIAVSRSSGSTPFFVHVSASAITATGSGNPYEDLEFSWSFGDVSGTEIFIDPTIGAPVNLNSVQTGPEAAYCYRNAGTYTVTLTCRGKNCNGFTINTATTTIMVSAFSPAAEYWFDSVNGSDANNGTSVGTPKQSLSALQTLLNSLVNNTRINLAKGSSWAGGMDMSNQVISHIRFQAYGGGAAPLFTVNSTASAFFTSNGTGSVGRSQDDVVVSGISFTSASGFVPTQGGLVVIAPGFNASATLTNFYFDNCTISQGVDPSGDSNAFSVSNPSALVSNIGLWGCTIGAPVLSGAANHLRQGAYIQATSWAFSVAGAYSGSGSSNTFDHHNYNHVQYHGYYAFNNFGATVTAGTPTKNFCIKNSHDPGEGDGSFYAQYFSRSRNYMSGTQRAYDTSNINNDPTTTRYKQDVAQQNAILGLPAIGNILLYNSETHTCRDNKSWGCLNTWMAPSPNSGTTTYLVGNFYRNRVYKTDAGQFMNWTGITWTTKQQITDNIFEGTSAAPNLNDIVSADQVSAGSLIDRNGYYAPNAGGNYLFDGATGKTFGQWQGLGWDTHGNTNNPNWPDPANGNFGSWP